MVYSLLSGPMVHTLFPCFPRKMAYTIAFFCSVTSGSGDRPRKEGSHSGGVYSFRSQKGLTKPKIRTNSTKEFSEQFKGVSVSLPYKARVLRQIAPESSPERSAKSLRHSFFVVPFLSPNSFFPWNYSRQDWASKLAEHKAHVWKMNVVPFWKILIHWRCGNHPHPHKMRKLRPKLRPRRISTARIQKYCKTVGKRKLRPWSEFPPRQNSDHGPS